MSELHQGYHYLIDLYGCEYSQINNKKNIETILLSSINKKEVKVLHKFFYKFKPHGVTGFLLLSASHISIHTWPEKEYVAVDIFTCISKEETEKIIKNITEKINHKDINTAPYKRGFLTENHE